jgi:hypothetical protein
MNMLLLTIKLICLDSIQVNDSSIVIYYNQNQSYHIDSSIKNYGYASTLIQRSFQRQHPIAVSIGDSDEVIEVLRADNDFISGVGDTEENKNQVHFQGHDGRYYVDTHNANYESLLKKINQSIMDKQRVWFIAAAPGLTVYDLILESELKKIKNKKWW